MSADPEVPPTTPPATTPEPSTLPASAGSGLPKNIAACVAAVFPPVGGIVFYMLDRKDPYVRFYSVQSIFWGVLGFALFLAAYILLLILHGIPVIGWLLARVFQLADLGWAVILVICAVNAYRGKEWQIPFFWPLVKKYESKLPQ